MPVPPLPAVDADHGEALLRRLDDLGVGPDVALWWWEEASTAWHYVVAGGGLPEEPDRARAAVESASVDVGASVEPERLTVLGVDDERLVALGTKVQIGGVSRVQLAANRIAGATVPPCLVYRLKLPGHGSPSGRRDRTITVNGERVSGTDEIDEVALAARRRRRAAKAETRAAKAQAMRARRTAAKARRRR
ncbi:MAG: hypothetical protein AAFN30_02655 [Actinomycetota bacterium]